MDLLDFSDNELTSFCSEINYTKTISELNLSNNKINRICENTLEFLKTGKLNSLNIANNSLRSISPSIRNISSLNIIKISGNSFVCDCDMTWMIHWLIQRTKFGSYIVDDYDQVTCHNGQMDGKLIYQLTPEEMGCYPHSLTLGEKLTIGILGSLIILIVIAIITISRRWNEVKWFLYLHFDILDKSDRNENLNVKKYDAFLSHR